MGAGAGELATRAAGRRRWWARRGARGRARAEVFVVVVVRARRPARSHQCLTRRLIEGVGADAAGSFSSLLPLQRLELDLHPARGLTGRRVARRRLAPMRLAPGEVGAL